MTQKPFKLPPTAWRLGWISFFADVASEMAYPILPLFLRSLGAPMVALGLIEGLADGTANVLKGISGARSDKLRKRVPYVRAGYFLSACGKPLIALAYTWPLVTVARVLDRYGKGIRTTARDAMLADAAPKEHFGAVFGLHRAMDTAGAFVGVLVALALLQVLPGAYRTIFLLAAIPGFVAVLLALGLKDKATEEVGERREPVPVSLSPELRRVILLHSIFAVANTSDTFLLLRSKDLGLSEGAVIGAYLMYNVAYALLSFPAGKLSDRVGRWPLVGMGWTAYAFVYLGFALLGQAWTWPLFLVYGLYVAFSQGVAKAQIAELAPKEQKGTVLGRFYMITGLCSLMGNLIFGLAWDRFGAVASLIGASVLAALAVLLIPLMRPSVGAGVSES